MKHTFVQPFPVDTPDMHFVKPDDCGWVDFADPVARLHQAASTSPDAFASLVEAYDYFRCWWHPLDDGWEPGQPLSEWAQESIRLWPYRYSAEIRGSVDNRQFLLPPNPHALRGETVFARDFDHRFSEDFYKYENPTLATLVERDLVQSGLFSPTDAAKIANRQPPL